MDGIDSVTNPSTGTSTPSSGASSTPPALAGEEFLTLLVTQLQYQDPLSPLETFEFTQQLASLASLEQLFRIEEALLVPSTGESGEPVSLFDAAELVGREVDAPLTTIDVVGGRAGTVVVDPPDGTRQVRVEILDADGEVLRPRTVDLPRGSSGPIEIDLDAGTQAALPEGEHTLRVTYTDASGQVSEGQALVSGTVEAVLSRDGEIWLVVEGRELPLRDVLRIAVSDDATSVPEPPSNGGGTSEDGATETQVPEVETTFRRRIA